MQFLYLDPLFGSSPYMIGCQKKNVVESSNDEPHTFQIFLFGF